MKTTTKRMIALAGVLALGLTAVRAQSDGALLDALVRKGVLSDKEAEDIRASDLKEYDTTPAAKLSLSDHISQLKLYGDARMRFEYLDESPQNGGIKSGGAVDRNRYRLRVGADYTFTDNFKAGFELESNTANDSANQTFGNSYGKAAINIGLVYLQWKPVEWLTLTGGKQRNPLYSTDLEWDPDINPEGGSEVMSWTIPIDGDSGPVDPKDLKTVRQAPSDMSLTIGLTAFQGIYSDDQEFLQENVAGSGVHDSSDVWQFVEQVPVQFNFNKDTYIKVVPGFDTYTSGGNISSSFGGLTASNPNAAGGGTLGFVGPNIADHLQILTAPGEVDWKMWNQPFKVYWDFADNLDAHARVQDVYLGNGESYITDPTLKATQAANKNLSDGIAWLAGVQVGQNKKKGDWSVKGDFRQVGLGSIDPNENDSDWGDSFLNQQGIKIQSTYNFTDFLTGSVTFYDTWAYKSDLLNGTPGQIGSHGGESLPLAAPTTPAAATGGYAVTNPTTALSGLAGAHTTQKIQVDLQWKF